MFYYKMDMKYSSCVLILIYLTNYVDGFKIGSTDNFENGTAVNATDNKSSESNITIILPENVTAEIKPDSKIENVLNILEQNNGTGLNKTKGILPNLNDFDTPLNYSYAASMLYPHYTKFYIEPTPKPQKSRISKRLARPANFVMQRKEKYFDVDPVPGEEDDDGTRIAEESSKIADYKKSELKNEEQSDEVKSEEEDESEENKEKEKKNSRSVRDKEQVDEGEEQEEDGEGDEDYEDEYEDEEEENDEVKQKIIEKSRTADSKEDAADLSEDEAHVNYALSLDKNIPKTAEKLVADSEAEGSKKEADHIVDHAHEKGGGKKHHAEHHGEHGEHGEKGYKGFHKDTKGAKGHHDKEAHKHNYDDKGGHEKQHHEEQGHHGEHHQGEKGSKHAEYEESGQHSKGHSTKGSHDIHKKDEYEKKVTFFEEDGDSGEEEMFGGYSEDHAHGKGGEYHKGHHNSKDFHAEKGDEKHFTEGGHHMDNKGHKKSDGHSGHHAHHMEFGKKNGKDVGKKWGYAKGLGGGQRSAKIIQHRSDKGDLGHDGQASEHRGVIQKPKLYNARPVHPYVEGAAFIQRRNDVVAEEQRDLDAHTNAYKQFPLDSENKPETKVIEATHFVQRRMDDVGGNPEQYDADQEEGVEKEQITDKEHIKSDDVYVEQNYDGKEKVDNANEAENENEKGEKKVQVVKYEQEFENKPTDTVQETTKYSGYLVNEQAVESTRFGEQEPFVENKDNSERVENIDASSEDISNRQEVKRDVEKQYDDSNSQESTEQKLQKLPESRGRELEEIQVVGKSENYPNATITEYDDVIDDYPEGVRAEVTEEDLGDHKKENLEILDDEEEKIVHENRHENIPEEEEKLHTNSSVDEDRENRKTVIVVSDDEVTKNISNPFILDDDNDGSNLYDEIVTRNKANDVAVPEDTGAQRRSEILKAEREEYIRLAAQSRGKKRRKGKKTVAGNITARGPRSTAPTEDKLQEKLEDVEKLTVSEHSNNNTTSNTPVKRSKKRSKKAKSKKNKKKKTTTTEQPEVKEGSEGAVAGDSADFF